MKLYNTLTRKKEEVRPLDGKTVRIYSCGPTVYGRAHIGNLRRYIFEDILVRVLERNGFSTLQVMNITDVGHLTSDGDEGDDKMALTARASRQSPWEIAGRYTRFFIEDCRALNIRLPELLPKATEHIVAMIDFVKALQEKGYAYETGDGIYFDIGKFKNYGKLSRLDVDGQIAGARVAVNSEKRHPADFALWKKAPPQHIMQWPSPWGQGYPGWHIECSAMSLKYLGEVFDIHTGGVDHIPVHHENEIAQSEALLGRRHVEKWLHSEFLQVDGGKMSKSLGNDYIVPDIAARGCSPLAYRYFCLNAHYRKKLNFTWEGLRAAQTAYGRLLAGVQAHKTGAAVIDNTELAAQRRRIDEALADDLNVPEALGIVWGIIRRADKSPDWYALLLDIDRVLGLELATEITEAVLPETDGDAEIKALVAQRDTARKNRQWAVADELRAALAACGIILEDRPDGTVWRKAALPDNQNKVHENCEKLV